MEGYRRDVDRKLLRANLEHSPEERLAKLQGFVEFLSQIYAARHEARVTDFAGVLRVLLEGRVEFILVGGVAAAAHGSARATYDLDVAYSRSMHNISRLAEVLGPLEPHPRGAPPGSPFVWDAETITQGLNFTLTTSLGDLTILGQIVGGGDYHELLQHAVALPLFGTECLCLDLDTLIHVKRAVGGPKEFEAIAELEALREEKEKSRSPPDPPFKRLVSEILARFPEIIPEYEEHAEDEQPACVLMGDVVDWLNLMGERGFDPAVVQRVVEFAQWCESQPRGETADDDIYTVLVVAFYEALFFYDRTKALIPHLMSKSELQAGEGYWVTWVGREDYEKALERF